MTPRHVGLLQVIAVVETAARANAKKSEVTLHIVAVDNLFIYLFIIMYNKITTNA